MKAKVISENSKRKTAQIVIHYEDSEGCKRSESRHCKRTATGLVGRVLDMHENMLRIAEGNSGALAYRVDSLNAELGNKAQKAKPYTAQFYVTWVEGETGTEYRKFIADEKDRAIRIGQRFQDEISRLEPLAEVRRAEKEAKRAKAA